MERKTTMKQWPPGERPYERCRRHGPEALTDAELLAVLLRSGTRDKNSVDLARELLSVVPEKGLLGLVHLSAEQLRQIKGIGPVKAIQILALAELSRRMAMSGREEGKLLNSPQAIGEFYMEKLRYCKVEEIWCVYLNTKNRRIGDSLITKGTVNMSLISPREILLEALRREAVSFVLIHNHPSGDPTPSREDILATRRLKDGASLVGLCLLDHLVVGHSAFISLKEQGYLP